MFEEALFHLLNVVHNETGCDALCLAGGCGNNSVANGKIRSHTNFKHIYVAASAGDAGGAVGAALVAHYNKNNNSFSKSHMKHAYLGPSYDNGEIKNLLSDYGSDLPMESFALIK